MLGFITLIVGVGFIVFILVGIWAIYRIVRGLNKCGVASDAVHSVA